MSRLHKGSVYVALLHYPVKNKEGRSIASAVPSIDLHDIARAARTYGAAGFYVINPLEDQRLFAEKIIGHWTKGAGARYNPDRSDALSLIRIRDNLDQAIEEIRAYESQEVLTVATSAAEAPGQIGFRELRRSLEKGKYCCLLALGTAWGLCGEFLDSAHLRLEPISGNNGYNHLSVRSAASIMLDRLLGPRRESE